MNEAFNLDNMTTYMKDLNIKPENNVVYGQVTAGLGKTMLLGGFVGFAYKHFLLHFNTDKITVIGLTSTGNFGYKDSVILMKDISNINFKKGKIQDSLTIYGKGDEVKFKLSKVLLGSAWQKENLDNLIQKNFYFNKEKNFKDNIEEGSEETTIKDIRDNETVTKEDEYFEDSNDSIDNKSAIAQIKKPSKIGKILGLVAIAVAVIFAFIFIISPTENEKVGIMKEIMSSDIFINKTGASINAKDFIKEHEEFFPAENDDYKQYLNENIQYKHLTKNIQNVGDELIYTFGNILQISEINVKGKNVTIIHLEDLQVDFMKNEKKPGNHYYFVYFGVLPSVYEGDTIQVVGLPYEGASFNNSSGGITDIIVCTTVGIGK